MSNNSDDENKLQQFQDMPGWLGLPIVGVLPFVKDYGETVYMDWVKNYGQVFRVVQGSWDCVVVNGYDAIYEALVLKKSDFSDRVHTAMISSVRNRGGIFFNNYSESKKLHSFYAKHLQVLTEDLRKRMIDNAEDFYNNLEENFDLNNISMKEHLDLEYARTIIKLFIGDKSIEADKLQQLLEDIYEPFYSYKFATIMMMPWLQYIPPFSWFIADTYDLCMKTNSTVVELFKNYKETNKHTILSSFYQEKPHPTEKDLETLASVFIDMIFAGSRTTSYQTNWVIFLLLKHPEKLQKLKEELTNEKNVLKCLKNCNFFEKSSKLSYLRSAVYETLRMRPISPLGFYHSATKNTSLYGYKIPKGTLLSTNIWSVHHDAELWGASFNEFKPERHLNDQNEFVKSKYIISFSMGNRSCIGTKLAEVQMMLHIALLFKRFEVSLVDKNKDCDLKGISGSTLKPSPFRIQITPLKH